MNYDFNIISENLHLTIEDVEEVMELFISEYSSKRFIIIKNIENNDLKSLISIFHTFKGATRNIQLFDIGELFYKMESCAKNGDEESIKISLLEMDDLVSNVKKNLVDFFGEK